MRLRLRRRLRKLNRLPGRLIKGSICVIPEDLEPGNFPGAIPSVRFAEILLSCLTHHVFRYTFFRI